MESCPVFCLLAIPTLFTSVTHSGMLPTTEQTMSTLLWSDILVLSQNRAIAFIKEGRNKKQNQTKPLTCSCSSFTELVLFEVMWVSFPALQQRRRSAYREKKVGWRDGSEAVRTWESEFWPLWPMSIWTLRVCNPITPSMGWVARCPGTCSSKQWKTFS